MFELLKDGGPIMVLIFACGFAAAAVFLERLFHLHRAQIHVPDFIDGLFNVMRAGHVTEAVTLCESTPGPVARLLRAAVLHHEAPAAEVRRAVEDAGRAEIPRIERRVNVLATIAHIAPLLGLLGTVLGMLEVTAAIRATAPLAHAGDLAGGLWRALLTTAAGLAVAIPSAAAYNVLLARIDALLLDMETAASEVNVFLARLRRTGPEAGR